MSILPILFMAPLIILPVLGIIIYVILRMNRSGDHDSSKNPFKILFYILAVIVALVAILFIGNFTSVIQLSNREFAAILPMAIIFPIFMLIPLALFVLLGKFIYNDAKSRGMDPWLWLLVVIFVPNFIGLIIYLIVRNSYNSSNKKCFNCGSFVRDDYNMCPNCGSNLKKTCSQCGRSVEKGWSICPYCGNNLNN